jgi:DNA polymerase-3 subunit beta
MKVKVDAKQFKDAIKNCPVDKNPILPILQPVMLKTIDNQLIVYSTDLETYTIFTLPAEVEDEDILVVNYKKLLDILKTVKSKDVEIRKEDGYLFINNAKIKLELEPDDFPLPEAFPSDLTLTLSGKELLKGINKTSYAVFKDGSRFTLNGVCFSFTGNKLDFVATDRHRLALYSTEITGKGLEGKYVIPKKTIKILRNLLKQTTDVEFTIANNTAFFKFGDVEVQAKLLEGVFPDYYQVIPKSFNIELKLDRYFFLNLLLEVISVIEDRTKPVIMTISNNRLTVAYTDKDISIERFYDLDKTYPDFRIGFNGKYLFEAINCIDDRYVIVRFIDKDSQAVIAPENPEERYLAVVMPMTI